MPLLTRFIQSVARLQYSTDQQRSLASHKLSKSTVNRPDVLEVDLSLIRNLPKAA
jgi:hypothetical protein